MNIYLILILIILLIVIICINEPTFFHRATHSKVYSSINWEENYTPQHQRGKIVFCGLARNIESKIEDKVQMCVSLGSYFDEYKVVIFENDSSDKTREIIDGLSHKNENIALVPCKENDRCKLGLRELRAFGGESSNRIDKMANLRNRYLKYIYENLPCYDYVCVLDFDCDGYMNLSGFMSNFSLNKEWDAIACTGLTPLFVFNIKYDSLAYVPLNHDINFYYLKNYQDGTILRLLSQIQMQSYLNEKEVYYVRSAFSGSCLYKMSSIKGKFYKEGWRCEHIGLHSQLNKVAVNPSWMYHVGRQGV